MEPNTESNCPVSRYTAVTAGLQEVLDCISVNRGSFHIISCSIKAAYQARPYTAVALVYIYCRLFFSL